MKRLVIVPEHRIHEFFETVEKINKKAEKYNCEKISILSESELYNLRYETDGIDAVVKDFIIELPQIKIGDYQVIGVIEHPARNLESAMAVQFYGEEGLSKRYADITPYRCDHCNTKRYRNTQIVLRNSENKEIVVGKSCVEEYTGIKLSNFISFTTIEEMFSDEFDFMSGYNVKTFSLKILVKQSIDLIQKYGYIKKCEQDIQRNLIPTFIALADNYNGELEVEDSLLEEYREYIRKNTFESDFMNNLRNISKLDYVVSDYFPMIVAGVNMFLKNRQYQERQKLNAENVKNCEYVGNEGEKINVEATVERISYFETQFGISARVLFNSNGNQIVWFTNVNSFENQNIKENQSVKITATVKKHDTFRDMKQTVVTRVKVLK